MPLLNQILLLSLTRDLTFIIYQIYFSVKKRYTEHSNSYICHNSTYFKVALILKFSMYNKMCQLKVVFFFPFL